MKLKSAGKIFLWLVGAAAGFGLLLAALGVLARPDMSADPPSYSKEEIAAVKESLRLKLDPDNPPRLQIDVDYSKGESAHWYPKGESPVLAELVKQGKLPPVDQRVGPEPCVIKGVDGIGKFGGTWFRVATYPGDMTVMGYRMAYANLVRFSPQGYPLVPHLAKSFSVSPDNKEFTFTLRKGVRWSDGHPFTADDIMYWWNHECSDKTIMAEPPQRIMKVRGEFGHVEKLGKYRVKFVFPHPHGIFLARMATYPGKFPLESPEHYLRKYHPTLGDKELIARYMKAKNLPSPEAVYLYLKDERNFNPEHPRLWPWVYRTYKANPPQTFVRNPYYWVVDPQGNQLPYVDRVLLEIKSAGAVAMTAADGGITMQTRHLFFRDYELLMGQRAKGDYEVYFWYSGIQSRYLISPNMNLRVDPDKPETRLKHELLNDKRFRQAMSLAINRQAIIDAEHNGIGNAAQAGPGPGAYFYNEGFYKSYAEYAPKRANELLDEIGLTGRDYEGYRTFKDGSHMTFFLNYCEWTTGGGPGPGQFIVDDWAGVGVRVILREQARTLFSTEMYARMHDFSVFDGGALISPLTPNLFLGGDYALGYRRWFDMGGLYKNPRADAAHGCIEPKPGTDLRKCMELVDNAVAESDKARQRKIFNEIFRIAAENVWTINISTGSPLPVVVKNGFRNVPRTLVFSHNFMSPGNGGIETFYFEKPYDSPGAIRQIMHDIVTVTPAPDAPASVEAEKADSIIGKVIRFLFIGVGVTLTLLVAVKHPYVGRRLLIMIPTLLIISIIVFTVIQLPPGDFITSRIMQLEMSGDEVDIQKMEEIGKFFHLEEPAVKRYARWMGLMWFTSRDAKDKGLLQGNMGRSMENLKSVNDIVGDRILLTFLISLGTILFTWAVAVPIGIYSAVKQYSIGDYIFTFIGFIGMCIPGFLLALLLTYVGGELFGIRGFGLFSSQYGAQPEWTWGKVIDLLKHIWVPVVVMGVGGTAGMIRVMRGNLLDELKKPYVVTARAKGVRPIKLLMKYPVRLALNPFISGIGGIFPMLVSGGAIVAMVLGLTTVGPLMLEALMTEDMFVAGSMLMVLSLLGVFGTLVSDLLLLWVDPRIRFKGGSR